MATRRKRETKKSSEKSENKPSLKEKLFGAYKTGHKKKNYLKTSIPSFNRALSIGGFPVGCVAEFYGPNGFGKTTLAGAILADVSKQGHYGCIIDIEASLDKDWWESLGVDFDKIQRIEVSFIQDLMKTCYEMINNFHQLKEVNEIDKDKFLFIVIDTITNAVPEDEESDYDVKGYSGAQEAGYITRFTKRLLSKVSDDVTVICLNQVRDNLNKAFFHDKDKVAAGGNALKHNVSVRIETKKRSKDYDDSSKKKVCGHKLEMIVEKSKNVGINEQPFELFIANGLGKNNLGIDYAKTSVSEAINQGIIEAVSKVKYYVNFLDKEFLGAYRLYDHFRNNPKDLDKLNELLENRLSEMQESRRKRKPLVNSDDCEDEE